MFVGENAFEDEKLLTFGMFVSRKHATQRISHDARCASDFVSNAIEHNAIDT